MYRLMINLIFRDLPEIISKQESHSGEEGYSKYAHHHSQAETLFSKLKDTVVDYSKYPTYKGTEKFQLEKLGREYVSILR